MKRKIQISPLSEKEKDEAENWIFEKCPKCIEHVQCFSKSNQKISDKRNLEIQRLGFCEDYVVDSSQLLTNPRQVCQEEVSFDELMNRGYFPMD